MHKIQQSDMLLAVDRIKFDADRKVYRIQGSNLLSSKAEDIFQSSKVKPIVPGQSTVMIIGPNNQVIFGRVVRVSTYTVTKAGDTIIDLDLEVEDANLANLPGVIDIPLVVTNVERFILCPVRTLLVTYEGDIEDLVKNDYEWFRDNYGKITHLGHNYNLVKIMLETRMYEAEVKGKSDGGMNPCAISAFYQETALVNQESLDIAVQCFKQRVNFERSVK